MKNIKEYILGVPRPFLFLSSILSIFLLGIIDYKTGIEYSFSLFYLLPIMLVTWSRGLLKGFICSVQASLIWYTAEILGNNHYSHLFIPFWNTLVRFSFYIIVILLIQRISNLHQKSESISRSDYLTGFHNIRSFYEQLGREKQRYLRTKRPFSLAYIDIDNFKKVNDKYGHEEGNVLLKIFSEIVKNSIRQLDIPARIGGDEFIILFPETDELNVLNAMEKIVENLHKNIERERWGISYSIGIVTFHKVPESVEEMIKMSDQLMYKAKKDGKDRIESTVFS